MSLYSYPTSNSDIINRLNLQPLVKGACIGYFDETQRSPEAVESPFADGAPRPVSTTIYFLLTPQNPFGYFHRNRSPTMHFHHQGRAEFITLTPTHKPTVTTTTLGTDFASGEVPQFIVSGGLWKMSRLPLQDVEAAAASKDSENVGSLQSVVVTPGFVPEDSEWLTMEQLQALFDGVDGGAEMVAKFSKYIKPAGDV